MIRNGRVVEQLDDRRAARTVKLRGETMAPPSRTAPLEEKCEWMRKRQAEQRRPRKRA